MCGGFSVWTPTPVQVNKGKYCVGSICAECGQRQDLFPAMPNKHWCSVWNVAVSPNSGVLLCPTTSIQRFTANKISASVCSVSVLIVPVAYREIMKCTARSSWHFLVIISSTRVCAAVRFRVIDGLVRTTRHQYTWWSSKLTGFSNVPNYCTIDQPQLFI